MPEAAPHPAEPPRYEGPRSGRAAAPLVRVGKAAGIVVGVVVWLLVGLVVLGIGLNQFWDAYQVSAGHGTPGTWVSTQYRCTSEDDCSWYGTFTPSDPRSPSLDDVALAGGSARRARDTLDAVVITDMGGPQAFWVGAGMSGTALWGVGAVLLAATWVGLPWLVNHVQGRARGGRRGISVGELPTGHHKT